MSITKAIAAQREKLQNKEDGFTLIELLVVVIIIGILAAIAIPVFLGQQTAAQNAAYQSDLATAKVAYVSSSVGTGTLESFGWPGDDVVELEAGSTPTSFCIDHAVGGWSVTESSDAPAEVTCAARP